MRIFDVLFRNVIDDAREKDIMAKVNNEKGGYVASLVESVRKCGVSFDIWTPKGQTEIDWTSLCGGDMKKVMTMLPDLLMFVVHNDTHDTVAQIWRRFLDIYKFICSTESERKSPEIIFIKIKDWVKLFLSLQKLRNGYGPQNITPYIHCLLYHVPFFVSTYGNLKQFSGQPTEKVNDSIKLIHHSKTNFQDCAMDAMRVRKRIEMNVDCHRSKRNYQKKKDDYWEAEIKNIRMRKKASILKEIKDANVEENECQLNIEEMSVAEIKEKLKGLGITTKIRKKEKLVALLRENCKV